MRAHQGWWQEEGTPRGCERKWPWQHPRKSVLGRRDRGSKTHRWAGYQHDPGPQGQGGGGRVNVGRWEMGVGAGTGQGRSRR